MRVPIILNSNAQEAKARRIAEILEAFGVKTELYIACSFKVPEMVMDMMDDFNKSGDKMVLITISDGSDGLSGMVAANSIYPVIGCPSFKDSATYMSNIHSSLNYPEGSPSLLIKNEYNAALAALKIFALENDSLRKKMAQEIVKNKDVF